MRHNWMQRLEVAALSSFVIDIVFAIAYLVLERLNIVPVIYLTFGLLTMPEAAMAFLVAIECITFGASLLVVWLIWRR